MIDRKELTGSIKEIVDNWDKHIMALENNLDIIDDATKGYETTIAELKEQRKEIQEKINTLENAEEEHLEELKASLEHRDNLFKKSVDKAKHLFKHKH